MLERGMVHSPKATAIRVIVALFLLPLAVNAAEPLTDAWFVENYTKREYRIPMRDGVELYTVVYSPKDHGESYPILLQRTPYNLKPYTVDSTRRIDPGDVPDSLLREKFIIVMQDVRGRFASGGSFVDVRPHNPSKTGPTDTDESTDTWDTIDWLVKNVPRNNGNVGMLGISYPGFYAAMGMIDSHPALKAVSPQAPVADLYNGDDTLHGGCFWLAHNFGFFSFFDQKLEDPLRQSPRAFNYPTPDGYEFFLRGGPVIELGDRHYKGKSAFWDSTAANIRDAAWREKHNLTAHLNNVRAAVLTVGGWFDAEDLSGSLKTYRATESRNPDIYNGLVMGPWSHGQWHAADGTSIGPVNFHSNTSEHFREEIELPFFRKYLKGAEGVDLPEAFVFETGTNEWRRESHWPPRAAAEKQLYLHAGGRLSFEPPAAGDATFDEYVSDPDRPVPFTQTISTGMPATYMIEDQRFAARRPDVLVYQTEPLTEDVTLVGPITASLHVSTTGTDSDWVVKLIDVYTADHPDPDPNPAKIEMGHYQQLVRGEPLRGKYRDGMDQPKPFEPGKVTRVEWTMPDICHTFRTGHRIMIQVQSSWFPLMDRNPQTFCDIYTARPEDYRKATQRVHSTAATPSGIKVLVLPNGRAAP